ncbi:hypothetical protein [Streptomyces sp. NPDC001492]
MDERTHERIPGDEWTASAIAHRETDLYAAVLDAFADLDLRQLTNTVLDHRQVDMPRVVEALDNWFGEIADPYADEDGEL